MQYIGSSALHSAENHVLFRMEPINSGRQHCKAASRKILRYQDTFASIMVEQTQVMGFFSKSIPILNFYLCFK